MRSKPRNNKTIVFVGTKKGCEDLSYKLSEFGAASIHGNKS